MITIDELTDLWLEWMQTDQTERFGQFFINRHDLGADPEIFYEENAAEAYEKIFDKFIKMHFFEKNFT